MFLKISGAINILIQHSERYHYYTFQREKIVLRDLRMRFHASNFTWISFQFKLKLKFLLFYDSSSRDYYDIPATSVRLLCCCGARLMRF